MSKLDTLADELFSRFERQLSLKALLAGAQFRKNVSPESVRRKLDPFFEDAREFRKTHRLWVLNWARVILKLQQRLLSAGYPADVVKPLLLGMIISGSKTK